MAVFKTLKSVPIVGRPVVVHEFRPIVVAQCLCGAGRPFVIAHPMESVACDACGARYAISQMTFDRDKAAGQCGVIQVSGPTTVASDD